VSTWGTGRGVPREIRVRVLERDGWRCQLGYQGCTFYATEVDHVVNIAQLGVARNHANDEENLQSVCAACHAVKTEAERVAGVRAAAQRRYERRHLPVPKKHPGEW
jgi:5-methylcytosine-specific restriction endonuclease McrA